MTKLIMGVLGSTRGSSLQAVINAINAKQLNASISLVVSNKKEAGILQRARDHAIAACYVADEDYSEMNQLFHRHHVNLIVLVGYMRILPKSFIDNWRHKIINVHPSLLPKHAGLINVAVHRAVLDAGDQETGCTVHWVDEGVDTGAVILQLRCDVAVDDTSETLKKKVQALEGRALVGAIGALSCG